MKNKKFLVLSSMMCAGVLVGCNKENTHVLTELIVSFPAERFQLNQELKLSEVKVYSVYKDGKSQLLNNKNVTFSDFVDVNKNNDDTGKVYKFNEDDYNAGMKAFTVSYAEKGVELTKEISVGVDKFFSNAYDSTDSYINNSYYDIKGKTVSKVKADINFSYDVSEISEMPSGSQMIDILNDSISSKLKKMILAEKDETIEIKGVLKDNNLVWTKKIEHNNTSKIASAIAGVDENIVSFNSVYSDYFKYDYKELEFLNDSLFIENKSVGGFNFTTNIIKVLEQGGGAYHTTGDVNCLFKETINDKGEMTAYTIDSIKIGFNEDSVLYQAGLTPTPLTNGLFKGSVLVNFSY